LSEEGGGTFGRNAWTPERTALWNALSPEEKKELEAFVANGSDAPVPEKWGEKSKTLRGVKQESVVPKWLAAHMGGQIGWTDAVIESVYARFYRDTNAEKS
tara:strand:+ start:732 stop:1034 length:303 start_codon:yes stop_codon:yes gene_type:complete